MKIDHLQISAHEREQQSKNSQKKWKVLFAIFVVLFMLYASVSCADEADLTGGQYAYGAESGINIPGWNTYNADGTPVKNASGIVAVLDSGIDYEHVDLAGILWQDGLKYPALRALGGDKYGLDVVDGESTMDQNGHGTHVAGIIGAQWNGIGVSGAASGIQILTVRDTNVKGTGDYDSIVKGLRYALVAKRAGVNIIAVNLSWGGNSPNGAKLDQLCRELGEAGVVTVIAAGNGGSDLDGRRQTASWVWTNPYVLVVGNSTKERTPNDQSDYGLMTVDVFAPGTDILSTYWSKYDPHKDEMDENDSEDENGNTDTYSENSSEDNISQRYGLMTGSSMAAPAVTGAVAVIASKYPDESPDRIVARVIGSARVLESFQGKCATSALVDVEKALGNDILPVPQNASSTDRLVTITGNFFGNATGKLLVDHRETEILTWTDTEIHAIVRSEFNRRSAEVSVTTAEGKSMSRLFDFTDSTGKIRNVTVKGIEQLCGLDRTDICASNDSIYVSGYTAFEERNEIYRIHGNVCSLLCSYSGGGEPIAMTCSGNDLILVRDQSLEIIDAGGSRKIIALAGVNGSSGKAVSIGRHVLFLESIFSNYVLRHIDLTNGKELERLTFDGWSQLLGFISDDEKATALVADEDDHYQMITFSLKEGTLSVEKKRADRLGEILSNSEAGRVPGFAFYDGRYWIYHRETNQNAMLFSLNDSFDPDFSERYAITSSFLETPQLVMMGDSLYALAASPTQIGCVFLKKLTIDDQNNQANIQLPQTGDRSHLVTYMVILCISVSVLIVLLYNMNFRKERL